MSSEAVIKALQAARAYVAEAAETGGYGFFPGGNYDPREFTPDEENTPEELAAHKAACEAWERGERPEIKRSGRVEHVEIPPHPDGKGGMTDGINGAAIVCGSSLGMGGYVYRDPEAMALLAQIDAALVEVPVSDVVLPSCA